MATASTCECISWQSIKLPCRHIFAVREKLGMELFDEAMCDKCWSAIYYRESQRILSSSESEDYPSAVVQLPPPKKRVLSQV